MRAETPEAKMAADSLRRNQPKDQWRERLEALMEYIQVEIDAI
jgi:hypothetical protein